MNKKIKSTKKVKFKSPQTKQQKKTNHKHKLPKPWATLKGTRPKEIDLSVFFENFVPPVMPGRTQQIERLKTTIDLYKKQKLADNLVLRGFTGSGKTSVMQYVIREYNDPDLFVTIKGHGTKNIKDVIAELGGIKPLARETALQVMNHVIPILQKRRPIIFIDDISTIPEHAVLLDLLCSIYREVQSPIFVTTHVFDLFEKLSDKGETKPMNEDYVRSLNFLPIDFETYDRKALYNILTQRIHLSGASFPDSSLRLISSLFLDQKASARDALYLARSAIQRGKTDEKSIYEIRNEINKQSYSDYIAKMSEPEQRIMLFLVERYKKSKESIAIREVSEALRLEASRSSHLVTRLENAKLIDTILERTGRGGNFRKINLKPDVALAAERGQIKFRVSY